MAATPSNTKEVNAGSVDDGEIWIAILIITTGKFDIIEFKISTLRLVHRLISLEFRYLFLILSQLICYISGGWWEWTAIEATSLDTMHCLISLGCCCV